MLTKAEKTKQFILETAIPLYNTNGIAGVSIDDVLAATKLTKGCLYGHFEGKDDLSEQVVSLALQKTIDKMRLTVAGGKTIRAKIFAFLDFYKDPIHTYIPGGCPIFNTAIQADDAYPVLKEKVAAVMRAGQQELTYLLEEGIHAGEFSSDLDAPVLAFKMVAAVEGGLTMCRIMDTIKPMHMLIKSLKSDLDQHKL